MDDESAKLSVNWAVCLIAVSGGAPTSASNADPNRKLACGAMTLPSAGFVIPVHKIDRKTSYTDGFTHGLRMGIKLEGTEPTAELTVVAMHGRHFSERGDSESLP